MSAQGVIAESVASFKITWDNLGNGQQPKWDQTKQSIELHQTDVYPDLQYVSAFAAPVYTKYTSGSLLNDLIVEINKVIDSKLASTSDKKEKVDELYLNAGPAAPKQLGAGPEEEDQIKADDEKPAEIIDTNKEANDEPKVTANDQELVTTTTTIAPQKAESSAYTVTVYGDNLRFLEGQEGRGAYSSGIKFLYKVSNNLTKQVAGEQIDNRTKIWAEVTSSGLLSKTTRLEFAEFDEIEFKFGGNLLAQVLPSIELSFTPDPNSVYSKEKPELDIADVIKATNITLGTKTTSEIKSLQKQIQKEIDSREPVEKQKQPGKQSASVDNK
ncbi:hypothetical protein UFOVP1604_17 [uncultured Caudovirales phage]|uniref:Uncharacterized protein n=1 Tax=uncultured Caudovirales phage TaxID=2100421 RepID=A0A6J5SV91_9CAUD|nr:hypothetical protein UFOVP1604_17 [uncultured Caudovirales phage]